MTEYRTLEDVLGREAQFLSRPVRLINAHVTFAVGHEVTFVIYEHDQPGLGVGLRYAVYADGKQSTGGVLGFRDDAA